MLHTHTHTHTRTHTHTLQCSDEKIQHISVVILTKHLADVLEVVFQFLHIQRVVFVFVAPLK